MAHFKEVRKEVSVHFLGQFEVGHSSTELKCVYFEWFKELVAIDGEDWLQQSWL